MIKCFVVLSVSTFFGILFRVTTHDKKLLGLSVCVHEKLLIERLNATLRQSDTEVYKKACRKKICGCDFLTCCAKLIALLSILPICPKIKKGFFCATESPKWNLVLQMY